MAAMRVAILEDNKQLLKDLKDKLEATRLVDVVAYADSSEVFLQRVQEARPDALILDIDLGGDSMTGLDVAQHLRLPALLVSGKTAEYIRSIEHLAVDSDLLIEHLTKPVSQDTLQKMLPKFIKRIEQHRRQQYVSLRLGEMRSQVPVDSIVCICTDKAQGAISNNKQIFFTDRKPAMLIDFSFTAMPGSGLDSKVFVQCHRSCRVHADKITAYDTRTHELIVYVQNASGNTEEKRLPVSENYRAHFRSGSRHSLL